MRKSLQLVIVSITVCLAVVLGEAERAQGGPQHPSLDTARQVQAAAMTSNAESAPPRFVEVRLEPDYAEMVAGEPGLLKIDIRIKDTVALYGKSYRWDLTTAQPIAWISTPTRSGISFLTGTHPDKPGQQVLVKFAPNGETTESVLTANVPYTVNSRTPAGAHTLWLDIAAPVVDEDGRWVQDLGVVSLPFNVDTHLRTKLLMLLIVAIAVFLFIVEWVRVDVVAIMMMVLLPELGLLDSRYTFRGLSSNAVVAIIGVMIISYGLNRVGLVGRLIQPLMGTVGKSVLHLTTIFSGLIATVSGVMQNTGAAVLFLPCIRIITSSRLKVPISRVLMPIGMAAILGGTLTMVGTSPLILLNDLLPTGMRKFGFLELTPIGLMLVLGGITYLSTVGLRILEKRPTHTPEPNTGANELSLVKPDDAYPEVGRLHEIAIPDDYTPGSKPQTIVAIRRDYQVNIVAISAEDGMPRVSPLPDLALQGGSVLCVYGTDQAVADFASDYGLVLRGDPQTFKNTIFNPGIAGTVEMVVSPRSTLIGQTIGEIGFRETYQVSALALHQNGETYYKEMADRTLQAGDAVLLHGTWEQIHSLQDRYRNFIIISCCESEFHRPQRARHALFCFLGTLALMIISSVYFQARAYNPIPLSVCLMLGAVAMILSKVVSITEAYRAVDWRTVFLLGGLIPLGMAVNQTGTAEWIAKGIVAGLGDFMSPLLLLIILAVLSSAFTLVISNVGACTLLVPLGISIANQIGADPRVAAIVVGIGVSNSFILPTHQVNALYMGPGEYRTTDFVKIGGGLSLIYIVVLVAMTYFFYL